MRTLKSFFSIFLLLPFALQCMEHMQASQNTVTTYSIGQRKLMDPANITEVFAERTADYFAYHATLKNNLQLIAKMDPDGHIDCCLTSFPRETFEGLDFDEIELPTAYFEMLETLFQQQHSQQ